jgi:hypothetical protein
MDMLVVSERLSALAVLALAACYQPSLAPCRVRCSDGQSCPSGFSCDTDQYCRPAGSVSSCDEILGDAPPLDMFDPACVGVVCDDPEAPACTAGVVRVHARPGSCTGGTCSYPFTDRTCVNGCAGVNCVGGWSTPTQGIPPNGRFAHSAVWTGSKMIIWGGATASTTSLADGAAYDPGNGSWTPISSTNAPSARRSHSAVWTGTEMIVWGGSAITQGAGLADGGRYNPATNTWTALSASGAPAGRFGHSAVWTGKDMVIWGGGTASTTSVSDGARFNPTTGQWTAISSANAPAARRDHSAVWTGTEMIVWGGSAIYAGGGEYGDSASYDPVANSWKATVTTGTAPVERFSHAAVWTGAEMLIWAGGVTSTSTIGGGGRLELVSNAWSPLPTTNEPPARRQVPAVWTGDAMLVFGGSTVVDGGSIYTTLIAFRMFGP